MKRRLIDLCCGPGGASVGYARAGFQVIGVDVKPQPSYPFKFFLADAMDFPLEHADVVHASPPCQAFTRMRRNAALVRSDHPDLVDAIRTRLVEAGMPYVIENVVGAPLLDPIQLCGSSFGLDVERHRLFELNWEPMTFVPACAHDWWTPRFPPSGNRTNLRNTVSMAWRIDLATQKRAMGVDWIRSRRELTQMIPPAYTEWIGKRLLEVME